MPYILILFGVLLLVSAIRGTAPQLGALLVNDAQGFVWFVIVIFALGALGYIKSLKGLSVSFMALVIIALILRTSHGTNLVEDFNNQVKSSFQ